MCVCVWGGQVRERDSKEVCEILNSEEGHSRLPSGASCASRKNWPCKGPETSQWGSILERNVVLGSNEI